MTREKNNNEYQTVILAGLLHNVGKQLLIFCELGGIILGMMIKLLERIEVNPNIMLGKPVIKGTRITVEAILRKLSQGVLPDEILRDYPHLEIEDIRAALEYAATSVSMEEIVPFAGSTV